MKTQEIPIEQIGPRLRQGMQELSEKEAEIIRGCLAMGVEIQNYSIHAIASRYDVSAPMIVKAAQRCGFSGFKELKSALLAYSQLPVTELHKELNPGDDAPTVVQKVFKTAISSLQETLAIFDYDALARAAKAMQQATTIDFYGVGGSGVLAMDAFHKFLRIGVRSQVFTDSHLMVMSANLLQPGSVVLGFSHSGRTRALIEAFSLARKQQATTILITNTPRSPLSDLADILLCSVAQGSPITGENAAARIVQLSILDALFVLVAQENYEKSMENLEQTIKSVSSLRSL